MALRHCRRHGSQNVVVVVVVVVALQSPFPSDGVTTTHTEFLAIDHRCENFGASKISLDSRYLP